MPGKRYCGRVDMAGRSYSGRVRPPWERVSMTGRNYYSRVGAPWWRCWGPSPAPPVLSSSSQMDAPHTMPSPRWPVYPSSNGFMCRINWSNRVSKPISATMLTNVHNVHHNDNSPFQLIEEWGFFSPRGFTILEVVPSTFSNTTTPMGHLQEAVLAALRVRQRSWCVRVAVVSRDPTFLLHLAQVSVRHRLLLWSTPLLVLTSLHHLSISRLLGTHWTFSMMNTVFLNIIDVAGNLRYSSQVFYNSMMSQSVVLLVGIPQSQWCHEPRYSSHVFHIPRYSSQVFLNINECNNLRYSSQVFLSLNSGAGKCKIPEESFSWWYKHQNLHEYSFGTTY